MSEKKSNVGVKISKSGSSVDTSDDQKINFTSKDNIFKIFKEGTLTIAAAGTSYVDHNLGYFPAYYVMGEINSGLGSGSGNMHLGQPTEWTATITRARLAITNASAASLDFFYYIFIEEGQI